MKLASLFLSPSPVCRLRSVLPVNSSIAIPDSSSRRSAIDYTGVSVAKKRLVQLLEKDRQLKKIWSRFERSYVKSEELSLDTDQFN